MTESNKSTVVTLEKIAIISGLIIQISAMVWLVAVLYSSVEFNKEELKEINSKLALELSDVKVRLRAAETEVGIMNSIINLELKRKNND